ncbi:hypothetical protein [Actinokineospora sp. NPDC004072]
MRRVVVIAAVLFLVGAPAAAQGPPVAIVGDDPVRVSAEPVEVEVVNNGVADVPVTVEAAALSDAQAVVPVEVQAAQVIPAAGSIRVVLTSSGADGEGWLVVRTESSVIRRAITVGGARTAVAAWSADWTRWTGFGDDSLPGRIPATCAAGATASTTLVSGDDTATLTATCTGDAYTLAMTDVRAAGASLGAGEYQGTLDVGGSEVAVTVKRSAPVLLAVALLLAGTVAALGAQTWIADRRPLRQRRAEVARITAPAGGVADRVITAAKADLDARLAAIHPGGRLRRSLLFWLPWPDGFAAGELAAIDAEIAQLGQITARHPGYTAGLATLAANRPLLERRAPGVLDRLDELTAPPLDLAPAELVEHITDAEHAQPLVDVATELDALWAVICDPDPAIGREHVDAAHLRYRELRARVARLTRPAEVAELRGVLAEVVALVDRLRPDAELADDADRGQEVAVLGVGVGSGMLDRAKRFMAAVARGTDRMAVRDSAVAVVVALVALWGGLSALYVGAVWGSAWDLVTAAVWGFGAVTVAAPLVTALKRIGSTSRE